MEQWQHAYLHISKSDIETELQQCMEEGRNIGNLADEFQRIACLNLEEPGNQRQAEALLDKTQKLPMLTSYPNVEPSDLPSIHLNCKRETSGRRKCELPEEALYDKAHGGWLGRACGCLLGKPVEGWRRERMWGYLKDANRWPLSHYFSLTVSDNVKEQYQLSKDGCFIENVQFMPEDDDMNYTTAGLAILKQHGPDFTPHDVASFWLSRIPILRTFTAERVAYRNFCMMISPQNSASVRNPYREWIGAQIRADFFGYVAPGDPGRAADFAWRDACVSHVKNGIYGEMWVAAMVAAAFVTNDINPIVQTGLAQIPSRSRLHTSICEVIDWHNQGVTYDEAVERLHERWDENTPHGWCHTISNAMVVAVGLLWGDGNYEKSICRAVQACFDTDCNGATVGSILGVIHGARSLPVTWTQPIHNTMRTGIDGYHVVTISDLARESVAIVRTISG